MDMPEPMRFFLSIKIKNENGIDVEFLLQNASRAIADKATYKFRVIGEAKIIAILEVEDDSVVNTVTSDIMRMGPYNVTCTPLSSFESWAKILHVGSKIISPAKHKLSGKYIVWFEVPLENHGIPYGQVRDMWKNSFKLILEEHRKGNIDTEIFKVLRERRLYVFSCKERASDWESHMSFLLMSEIAYKNSKLVTNI